MWKELDERALCLAEYIVQTGCTVRACAAHFSVSKSTVHKDMTERLPMLDRVLYGEVRGVLLKNLKERHLRGGDATRKKYELKRRADSLRFKQSPQNRTDNITDKITDNNTYFNIKAEIRAPSP